MVLEIKPLLSLREEGSAAVFGSGGNTAEGVTKWT